MNPRNVTIIPPTNPNQPNRYLGTPVKIHVVGYARVIKGTGAGVQIRKNIRHLIVYKSDWESEFNMAKLSHHMQRYQVRIH